MLKQSAHYLTPNSTVYSFCVYLCLCVCVSESCSWQGTVYRDGEEWKPSLCSRCVCSNGEVQCSVAECQQVACKPVSFWKYFTHFFIMFTLAVTMALRLFKFKKPVGMNVDGIYIEMFYKCGLVFCSTASLMDNFIFQK